MKTMWIIVGLIVCVLAVDIGWHSISPDVSYIRKDRDVRKRLSNYYQKLGVEANASVPLIDEYSTDLVKFSPPEKSNNWVIAADRNRQHCQQIAFMLPRYHYAIVLLGNGDLVEWTGTKSDYQQAVSLALANPSNSSINKFFRNSRNRHKFEDNF